jgi:hypothetical protein
MFSDQSQRCLPTKTGGLSEVEAFLCRDVPGGSSGHGDHAPVHRPFKCCSKNAHMA